MAFRAVQHGRYVVKQPWLITHAETITQNVVGQILYFLLMIAMGIPFKVSIPLQIAGFFIAYARSYAIRRFFDWFQHRRNVA